MLVHVLHRYQGIPSQNQVIWPGVYEADAKELFGLAAYLVGNEHAVWVETEPEPVVPVIEEVLPEPEIEDGGNELASTQDRRKLRGTKHSG